MSRMTRIVPYQPLHRLFPRLERRDLSLREALEMFVVDMRERVGPYPCRPLHERAIEYQRLFDLSSYRLIEMCSAQVSHRQYRPWLLPCDGRPHLLEQHDHFLARAMTEIDHEDGFPLVFHKVQPLFFEAAHCVVKVHASNPSTTP